jgi:hypothetical protein
MERYGGGDFSPILRSIYDQDCRATRGNVMRHEEAAEKVGMKLKTV